jgi:energy-coupling factor transporter ATP-binding protein EcfA2
MRVKAISLQDVPPITRFQVDDLADVVVLAGRNGIGKTRLIKAIVACLQSPSSRPNITLEIEATTDAEAQRWGKSVLVTTANEDAQKLTNTLQQSRMRANWRSSVVQFESDRSVIRVKPLTFDWNFADPWEENYGWDRTFQGLRERFQDTLHSIFRKVRSADEQIARRAKALRASGEASMPLDFPDPLLPFKEAFSQLLAPKELVSADLQRQTLTYLDGQQQFPIEELSSGEREVLNIVFDFILRKPQDCIVFFDEPELHLHPELSYKLLQTLKNVGARNQFVYSTHSPDIISASLDQSVVFVAPPTTPPTNQAVPVREQDDTNQALRLLGQSVGVIALGRKLVLIEGATSSLDKQVYGSILRDRFPGLVLVPCGGRGVITSFNSVVGEVLGKTLWGVEFFMLCDRDAVPITTDAASLETQAAGRLRVLKRYHLENYFLDASVLARAFYAMEQRGSWLRDADQVEARLRQIARKHLAYAVALVVSAHVRQQAGNVDVMPKGCQEKNRTELTSLIMARAAEEGARVSKLLAASNVDGVIEFTWQQLESALDATDATWKLLVPGRPVLNTFAAEAGLHASRVKTLYLGEAAKAESSPFQEVIEVFDGFANA